MASSSRTPYEAGTPEMSHFPDRDIALSSVDQRHDASVSTSVAGKNSSSPKWIREVSEWNRVKTHCSNFVGNNAGILLIASSQVFGSLMILAVKILNQMDPPVPPLELIWVRMLITWTCSVSYMTLTKVPDPIFGPKEVRWLLAFRGFSGFFGLFGIYYSLQYLSISDAVVLTFLSPMCTAIAGAILLKEHFMRSQAFASLLSLVGVILIARPQFLFGSASQTTMPDPAVEDISSSIAALAPTPSQRIAAVGVAMIGVLGGTGAWVSIRAIGMRAHPMHNLVAFSSQCIVASTVMMLIARPGIVISLDALGMIVLVGILGFMGQILTTMGLQRETAGRSATVVYIQIVFVTILDTIVFHTIPSFLSILGTIIILSSALYVGLNKPQEDKVETEDPSLEEGLLANEEGSSDAMEMTKNSSESS